MVSSGADRRSTKSRRGKISHLRRSSPSDCGRHRGSREKDYFLADGGFNAVRNCEAGLFFDVTPDLDEIERSLRGKNKAHAHLGLAFQIRQVSIQLILRDSFAAVELLDAAPNLCVDCFPVLQEPTILFFLGLQQTEQDFLDAARAGVRATNFLPSAPSANNSKSIPT